MLDDVQHMFITPGVAVMLTALRDQLCSTIRLVWQKFAYRSAWKDPRTELAQYEQCALNARGSIQSPFSHPKAPAIS